MKYCKKFQKDFKNSTCNIIDNKYVKGQLQNII